MPLVLAIALGVLKKVLISLMSEKFMVWLFFWAADLLVKKTATKQDDAFLAKVKEVYDESNGS